MREFERIVAEQLTLHPSMQPQDLCKLCYQAARGGEHLLTNLSGARAYLEAEFASVAVEEIPLSEPISSEYVRVNLAAWKAAGYGAEELFTLFAAGGGVPKEVEPYLDAAERVWCRSGRSAEALSAFLTEYRGAGCPSLHHSEEYRRAERPAYRVVRRELLDK